jgi:hypothetical protein
MGRALVAGLCIVAAAGAGYAVGRSGGADLHRARVVGERLGRERAARDRSAYQAAYTQGRNTGYREAYKAAYGEARKNPSTGGGP